MEIKNLTKAAERILKAVINKERIILYGDSDPDGVSSVLIAEETILHLGGKKPIVYFPDREKEGYGINEKALGVLKKYAPALFITYDCGITSVKETEIAKKMGFEVIIVDHHKVLSEVPKASIIVDPKQKGDRYPFKDFACGGVSYKLAQAIYNLSGKKYEPERFLELVLLATISDQMPLEDENKKLVEDGLKAFKYTKREGFKALIEVTGFASDDTGQFRQRILPPLNVWKARKHINPIYAFLKETSATKARKTLKGLLQENKERNEIIKRIFQEADSRADFSQEVIIFEGDSSWPLIFTGPIASRLCAKYQKPTFVYKKGKDNSPGACRTPHGLDVVKAMDACKKYMITYGGHPPAGGFRAKNENLDKIKACLIDYFERLR